MLKNRSFLTLRDFTPEELRFLLDEAKDFKCNRDIYKKKAPLTGKTLIMVFQKRSTRTRVTSELAMTDLGGRSIVLSKDDIHLGTNESIRDTALVLGRMASCILARVYTHKDLVELTKYAGIPVVNALSDLYHPLQGLADLLTIETHFGTLAEQKVAWVGDGNNVCHSLMIACAKMGVDMKVTSPIGYEPVEEIVKYCQKLGTAKISLSNDPKLAVSNATVVVTDTFISMGQENLRAEKLNAFKGFQVNTELIKHASHDYIFMHCLPRHPEEVTDEIFYGTHSKVFDEAENRLYTAAAVFKNII
ncbi:MAG TPA: ornithine carbamoyltransferase [Candidatus Deferrimicrobium sp.]|nr:ornithine carbamoyltransferase [Candidatus Deferrimicrobium sp.]